MDRADISDAQRELLREFRVYLQLEHPDMILSGKDLADAARSDIPELTDAEIAAVLCKVSEWLVPVALHSRCGHLTRFIQLISAVVLDLAHLEIT